MDSYRYHAQRQAEEFSRQILPVPPDYPLRTGLPEEYRDSFARLCELSKSIYLDMAREPEAYGLMLVDIADTDHNLARDSYRSIHRFVDTLNALFLSGEVQNHMLKVDAAKFKLAIRSLPVVPKYAMVLSKLCGFGLEISDFDGTAIDKKADFFAVKYPGDPDMIDTIKIYCECYRELNQFRRKDSKGHNAQIKLSPQEFHHHFYRFDYKITADLDRIPMLTWVNDEADFQGFDQLLKQFNEAFFLESLKYEGLKYDGDYHYKGKRIARITQIGYSALGKPDFKLSLKLKDMDKYIHIIEALPERIKEPMTKDSCSYCGFQGSTKEHCKFRLRWTLDEVEHTGCAFWCFIFDDFRLESVGVYFKLLELEYMLRKARNV